MNYRLILTIIGVALLTVTGCDSGPKVITEPASDKSTENNNTGIFSEAPVTTPNTQSEPSGIENVHAVVVEEVLPTEKYVYLHVKEGEDHYWIATIKQAVKVGETYFYREGLLKTNFKSAEYDRTFDKLYLVSNIVPADHGNQSSEPANLQATVPTTTSEKVERRGSVKIADLVAKPEKYEGKTIKVSGKCVKINPNIMGRNWIHLNDGSTDYDLVVTSNDFVSVGQTVTMTGTVVLNKDLGAGYFYDILLEDGVVVGS